MIAAQRETKAAIKVEHYLLDSLLCNIPAQTKSLEIICTIIKNTAHLRKTL